jgi:hypothetical protein
MLLRNDSLQDKLLLSGIMFKIQYFDDICSYRVKHIVKLLLAVNYTCRLDC